MRNCQRPALSSPGICPSISNAAVAKAAVQNAPTAAAAAQPPPGQMKALRQNNSGNLGDIQNAQNAALPAQLWRVTGQVQLGPGTRFNLEAASAPP